MYEAPRSPEMIFEAVCAVKRTSGKHLIWENDPSPWKYRGAINLTCAYSVQVALVTASLSKNLIIYEPKSQDEDQSPVPDLSFMPIVLGRAGMSPAIPRHVCGREVLGHDSPPPCSCR